MSEPRGVADAYGTMHKWLSELAQTKPRVRLGRVVEFAKRIQYENTPIEYALSFLFEIGVEVYEKD